MRVGVAGLGRMGAPMARNLARAGFALTVWNRTPDAARAFADETGCAVAATPRELAAASDVVVTMLADDAASDAVHLGPEGLFAAGARCVFLEMGTMSPDHVAALRADLETLRSDPHLADDLRVAGYVFDIDTGDVTPLVELEQARAV